MMIPVYMVVVPFIVGQVFNPHMMYVPPAENTHWLSYQSNYSDITKQESVMDLNFN